MSGHGLWGGFRVYAHLMDALAAEESKGPSEQLVIHLQPGADAFALYSHDRGHDLELALPVCQASKMIHRQIDGVVGMCNLTRLLTQLTFKRHKWRTATEKLT